MIDKWIWLDLPTPNDRTYTGNWELTDRDGTVAEFTRSYAFDEPIELLELEYSADSLVQLWINGRFIGTGPVWVGGDFLANDVPRTNRYKTQLTLVPSGEDDYIKKQIVVDNLASGRLEIVARVRLCPTQICEFSMGRGGFMLSASAHLGGGRVKAVQSDESWHGYLCPAYRTAGCFDAREKRIPVPVCVIEDIWRAVTSPLPLRVERPLMPSTDGRIIVKSREVAEGRLVYDKIYAGYSHAVCRAGGEVRVSLSFSEGERDSHKRNEEYIFVGDGELIGTRLYSVGEINYRVENLSNSDATLEIMINESFLPSRHLARVEVSDEGIGRILDVCRHTLKYCRQYIHLDSPKHCEPLACTGDYYIEAMMSTYSYADMTLASFDLVRTARALEHNKGVMFHPTYSLIYVRMLLEVYMRMGDISLLRDCEGAVRLLLDRFSEYEDNTGLIDTPPSFMFVDWINVDGYSLHHPPKALGQSVINMFYLDALEAASKIYLYLGSKVKSEGLAAKREQLKAAINLYLYDSEKKMYHEGLNTPTPDALVNNYMPKNTYKRYFRIHANALAVAFGAIEGEAARSLIRRLVCSVEYGEYQPYFAHFVLMAIHRTGLDSELALRVIDKWRAPVNECDKGLAEGFIPPDEDYAFDHSHAWGGTPLYSLPTALTSLVIEKAGMTELSLSPQLLGLDYATVDIVTPAGTVTVKMKKGEQPVIEKPDEITVRIRQD